MIIPQIIHFFNFADEEIQKRNECKAAWKALHPNWIFKEWTLTDVHPEDFPVTFMLKNKMETVKQLKDVCAYEVVKSQGGFCVDTDIMPLFTLDQVILNDVDLVICDALGKVAKKEWRSTSDSESSSSHEKNEIFPCDTGFFGAVPQHLCLLKAIHELKKKFFKLNHALHWAPENANEMATRSDPQEWKTGSVLWGDRCMILLIDPRRKFSHRLHCIIG